MLASHQLHLFCSVLFIFRKHGSGARSAIWVETSLDVFLVFCSVYRLPKQSIVIYLFLKQFWWAPVLVNRKANRQTPIHRAEKQDWSENSRLRYLVLSCHIFFSQNRSHRAHLFWLLHFADYVLRVTFGYYVCVYGLTVGIYDKNTKYLLRITLWLWFPFILENL